MEQYLDRVGSFDPDDIEDKSLKDIKKIVLDEVKNHGKELDEKAQKVIYFNSCTHKLNICSRMKLKTLGSSICTWQKKPFQAF